MRILLKMMLQLRLIVTEILKEKQKRKSPVPSPTDMHNVDGPYISADEVGNIAPGKG